MIDRNLDAKNLLMNCFAILCFLLMQTWIAPSIGSADDALDPNQLYGDARVTKIEITIDEEAWNSLRLQKREFIEGMLAPAEKPFDTFRADLRIDGVEIKEVGIRKKGFFGSLDDDFPSLRIKLDEYVDQKPIGDVKRLTLNNNKQDTSLLSQYMAYRFFNAIGVEAPRVGFATVFVNGNHLGVYSVVEPVDKVFLKSRFGDNRGDLWEGTLTDFSPKSLERLEWKSGQHDRIDDWKTARLSELLQNENVSPAELESLVDLTQFYQFWAGESLLAFWDGYSNNQNNYFVYDDPKSNKLLFMPWGADSLWSSMLGPMGGFTKPIESVYTNSLLCHRLFRSEEGRERYRQVLQKMVEEHWNEDELKEQIDALAKLVEPHLHKRQSGAASAQKSMKRFIDSRKKRVMNELESWPIKTQENPRPPMYSKESGHASGSFATFWERTPKGSQSTGSLTIQNGEETIELGDLKVSSRRFSMGMFGGPSSTSPAMIELVGKTPDGKLATLTLNIDREDFEQSEPANVSVSGSFSRGGNGFQGPFGGGDMRWIKGTCQLEESSMKASAPVRGSFDVTLLEIKGGFFARP